MFNFPAVFYLGFLNNHSIHSIAATGDVPASNGVEGAFDYGGASTSRLQRPP